MSEKPSTSPSFEQWWGEVGMYLTIETPVVVAGSAFEAGKYAALAARPQDVFNAGLAARTVAPQKVDCGEMPFECLHDVAPSPSDDMTKEKA